MNETAAEPMPASLRFSGALCALVLAGLVLLAYINRVMVIPPTNKDAALAPRLARERGDVRELKLTADDGSPLYGWLLGRDDAPVKVIQCMGNAEYIGPAAQSYADTAAELDAQFLLFDYRSFANSPGTPSERGFYSDARGAYAHAIKALRWRPSQVVVWGRSLGGGVATHLTDELLKPERRESLAAGGPPRALVLEAAFTSIPDMAEVALPSLPLGGWMAYSLFDNAARAPRLALPVFHFHGDQDEIVPFEHGRRLHRMLPGPAKFLPLPGTGHLNVWSDAGRAAQIRRELREFLAANPERNSR